MDKGKGLASGDWFPATSASASASGSASASASEPPPESSLAHEWLSDFIDYRHSYGGAWGFSPFSDLQTLESGFSQLGLSDSNDRGGRPRLHHPPSPLWNSGLYQGSYDFHGINVDGCRAPPAQQEAEREQINQQLQMRLGFQNDCVNGSFGFDDSRHSNSVMGQDRMLSNGFLNGNLGEVPYPPRNNSVLDQNPWPTSNSAMFRNRNSRGNNRPNFASLQRPANMVMTPKRQMFYENMVAAIEGPERSFVWSFSNVVSHVCELMVDPFGQHVFKKCIERCTKDQITQILGVVTRNPFHLVNICNDFQGARSIEELLRHLRSREQISRFMMAVRPVALRLTKNANGNHVILHCLSHFSPLDNMDCITRSTGNLRQHLIYNIASNALRLSNHCYGNFVVQFVLDVNDPGATSEILRQLEGSYIYLSREKHGSHVVQSILRNLGKEGSRGIVLQLLTDIKTLLIDKFGNYVVQSMWAESKDDIRKVLMNIFRENKELMTCSRFGKIILEKLNLL
ncbi:PREDICTED: putative pumilio homolog 13 isoform X2 [Tarenaya hassleriana]|uniref:putative pumilio homolog 13 isoform X2 n=1 Tax=Tarenaya hassleriana TaxID=28532 RepID=UPI00053C86E9|nr:PREDICTED: putative pumilio homolog 13 isoform X2 [Tarenaya hassleriana]